MYISNWVLLGILILFVLPYVKRIVYFPYLYLHEFGHKFMAVLLRVKSSRMVFSLSDGSGSVDVTWNTRNKIKVFFIGVIGYAFPVIMVYMGVWTLQNGYSHYFLIGLMIIIMYGIVNTKSFVGFTVILLLSIGGLWLYNILDWTKEMLDMVTMISVWILMIGCVVTGKVLINNFRVAGRNSNADASVLQNHTRIPDVLWITLFVVLNLYTALLVFWLLNDVKLDGLWI